MLTVDLNKNFTDISGAAIPNSNMAEVLAIEMHKGWKGLDNPKVVPMAEALYKTKKLEADRSDLLIILKGLSTTNLLAFVQVQLTQEINNAIKDAK